MSEPVVSVLMSVYNGAQFLREAVDSILTQSFSDLELIVINDGSTDRTGEILDEYQMKDIRVRVFHQENAGLIDSLNRGAGHARGKYIARMDADDIAVKERLAMQVSFMDQNPQIGALGGAIEVINATGDIIETCFLDTGHDEIRWSLFQGQNLINHSSVLMRADVFRAMGGYRKALLDAEDFDLWLRISDRFRLCNLDRVLIKYRRHSQQVSVTKVRQQSLSALAAVTAAFERLHGHRDPFDGVARISPEILLGCGVGQDKQNAAVIRGYLTCIRSMYEAGETTTLRDTIEMMLNSHEWAGIEPRLIADFNLLMALIHWREKRVLASIAALIHAVQKRPIILARPFKPMLRRLRPPSMEIVPSSK